VQLERFLSTRSADWTALEALVARAKGKSGRLSPSETYQLGVLYRTAAADLALARRDWPDTPGTRRLQILVASAHGLVYGKAQSEGTVQRFVTRRFWQRVRGGGRCLAISIGVLAVATILGLLWGLADPVAASGILPAGFHVSTHPHSGGLVGISIPARAGVATQIFTNNIEVAFETLVAGFTLGIVTTYLLAFNGAMLGVVAALMIKAGAWQQFVRLIVPHGLLELSCIAVAGSAGLQIARALIDPGSRSRAAALRTLAPALGDTILGVAACLVVAGMVEGVVTTWDLPLAAALTIGVGLGLAFWTLVAVRGGPDAPTAPQVGSGAVGDPASDAHGRVNARDASG
jgi:uncharacterized membrane protein SpoIIM required for sporulation